MKIPSPAQVLRALIRAVVSDRKKLERKEAALRKRLAKITQKPRR